MLAEAHAEAGDRADREGQGLLPEGPDPAGILGLTVHTIAPPSNGGPRMYQSPSQLMQLMQLMHVFSRSGRLTEAPLLLLLFCLN